MFKNYSPYSDKRLYTVAQEDRAPEEEILVRVQAQPVKG